MQRPAHEMIERYLYEVARRLPVTEREDVTQELRSLLLDGLEDREPGAPPDEERAVVELLRQMGSPQQIAARYQPGGRSLIGPHLYPVFLTVARYTLIGLTAVMVILPGLSLMGTTITGSSLGSAGWVAEWARLFVESAVFSLGMLVLVFALAERVMARQAAPIQAKAPRPFDPRTLPAIPAHKEADRISPGRMVAYVYAITALFVMLNFFPRWFGPFFFSWSAGGGDTMMTAGAIPLSALGVHVPVAIYDVWWVLAMALNLAVLRSGRWTVATRWAEIALRLLTAVVLGMTIGASSFGGYDAAWVRAKYPEVESAVPVLNWILLLTVAWMLVATVIGTVRRLYREARRAPSTSPAMELHPRA
ncbi:MAG: hypothetical protein LAQ69_00380 [Acidobacteriia bacterium]|nr:hypothetical protein [Terriglobia bacterium]